MDVHASITAEVKAICKNRGEAALGCIGAWVKLLHTTPEEVEEEVVRGIRLLRASGTLNGTLCSPATRATHYRERARREHRNYVLDYIRQHEVDNLDPR